MSFSKSECHYHDGYANLAAAIIAGGVRCHDTRFLKSGWCDTLREICKLDDQMYGGRNIGTRGRINLSACRGGMSDERN